MLHFQWFRDEITRFCSTSGHALSSSADEALSSLLSLSDPIYEVHCRLLKELEARLEAW